MSEYPKRKKVIRLGNIIDLSKIHENKLGAGDSHL
jgi:hypothetical protein